MADEDRLLGVLAAYNLVDKCPNRFKIILETLNMPSRTWRTAMTRKIKGIDRVPFLHEPLSRFSGRILANATAKEKIAYKTGCCETTLRLGRSQNSAKASDKRYVP